MKVLDAKLQLHNDRNDLQLMQIEKRFEQNDWCPGSEAVNAAEAECPGQYH
jgi:hypothetical protein